jgi:hypothetical protein
LILLLIVHKGYELLSEKEIIDDGKNIHLDGDLFEEIS